MVRQLEIAAADGVKLSAILLRPPDAAALLVLAHGAGAGMSHPFLESLAQDLADARIATLRYQFPYMQQKRKIPDRPAVLTAAVRAAVEAGGRAAPGLPLFAGGKSLGGRMTSLAASEAPLAGARGLVFVGFPLHAPNRPGVERAAHLARVTVPMLFLQGTRDAFADLALLRPIIAQLRDRATLHLFQGADHSFHVPKSSGTTDSAMLRELAQTVASWIAER